jgi:hypothetical protein
MRPKAAISSPLGDNAVLANFLDSAWSLASGYSNWFERQSLFKVFRNPNNSSRILENFEGGLVDGPKKKKKKRDKDRDPS